MMRRAVATVLVALTVLVPSTAAAAGQRPGIAWHDCGDAELDAAGVQCAELALPLDYAEPYGRTVTVVISRLKATDAGHRIGPLLFNFGGPGGTAVDDTLTVRDLLGEAAARFDIIGMDPRFVGRSSALDCRLPVGNWIRAGGPDRASFERTAAFAAGVAQRCGETRGELLPYVSTRNTARDIDRVRQALGAPKLSYLGYSYGTYLGAVLMQMFPHSLDRVVLDSAVDPESYGPRLLANTGAANEAALHTWAGWAAGQDRGLGDSEAEVIATVDRVLAAADRRPLHVGDFRVTSSHVRLLLFNALADDREPVYRMLAGWVTTLRDEGEPTPELADFLTFLTTDAESATGSVQLAIVCGDVPAVRSPAFLLADVRRAMPAEPHFAPITRTVNPCSFWPVEPREAPTRVGNAVPALIVNSTGDTRSYYAGAQRLHELLTASRMITLAGSHVHGVYGLYGNACVDERVGAYLLTARLSASDAFCQTA